MAVGEIIGEIVAYVFGDVLGGLLSSVVKTRLTLVMGEDYLVVKTRLGSKLVRYESRVRFARRADGTPELCGVGGTGSADEGTQIALRELVRSTTVSEDDKRVLAGAVLSSLERESRNRLGMLNQVPLRIAVHFEPRLELARELFEEAALRRSCEATKETSARRTTFEFPLS